MALRLLFIFSIALLFLSAFRLDIYNTAATPPTPIDILKSIPPTRAVPKQKNTDTTPDTFYQTIIDANIFRPLGWREPIRQPQYRLIGTITNTDELKALILDKHSKQLYTLTLGQKIGDAIVEMIQPKRVILRQDDKHTTLYITPSFLR